MKTFFETAVFIYALDRNSSSARKLFEQAINEGEVATSVITISEYTVDCLRKGNIEASNRFDSFLSNLGFEIASIDEDVARIAASIRCEYPAFKLPDALQIASALKHQSDRFVTNDKQLLQYHNDSLIIVKSGE